MCEVIVYKHLVSFQLTAAEVKWSLHKLQSLFVKQENTHPTPHTRFDFRLLDDIIAVVLLTIYNK